MTLVTGRLEALIVARAGAFGRGGSVRELIDPLAKFAPAELTEAAWRERLVEVVADLRARDVLDAKHCLRDAGELARRIGRTTARTWQQLAERVLPGLALGIAADEGKLHARLAGCDAWAAAIIGRTRALWVDGPPPSLSAVCDALAWRELGLTGKPQRCPPAIRALFVQRQFHGDAGSPERQLSGPPERLARALAAREVGAPRPDLRALREALVRCWLAGRTVGSSRSASSSPSPGDDEPIAVGSSQQGGPRPPEDVPDVAGEAPEAQPPSFASDVMRAASAMRDGTIGDRKVFVSAVWHELRGEPRWSALTLDDFKARLVAAHRAGELTLARADFVVAMDPELVAASEITVDGASFHFIVKEPVS